MVWNMSSSVTSTTISVGILPGVVFTETVRRVTLSLPPLTTPAARPVVRKGTSALTGVSSVTRSRSAWISARETGSTSTSRTIARWVSLPMATSKRVFRPRGPRSAASSALGSTVSGVGSTSGP